MTIPRFLFSAATIAVAVTALRADAQLLATVEPAVRHASVSEYNQAGARIVHESGWLPGVGAALEYRVDRWEMFGAANIFEADIDYDGKLQKGLRYHGETGTQMLKAQLGLRYRFLDNMRAVTALEYDSWKRDIKGGVGAIGLQEHTRSMRLLLGIAHEWRVSGVGKICSGVNLIHAAPERLDIQFSGLLDDVSMRTRSANGFAVEVSYHPKPVAGLIAGVQFDYMKVPRSGTHPVTRDGRRAGEVTQPEHVRQNVTLFVRYLF